MLFFYAFFALGIRYKTTELFELKKVSDSLLTVFTPTYNRANTLPRLFESLVKQTCQEFEWVVIDDGSDDQTQQLIENFVQRAGFPISFRTQTNGGKHRAINSGAAIARGEWFFILDSDDYLEENAIEIILCDLEKYDKPDVGLMFFLRLYPDGKVIGDKFPSDNTINFYVDKIETGIKGDKAELIKTSVLKEYLFPEYVGEKFIAESALWMTAGNKYRNICINKGFYICEYLEGGLSDNSLLNRVRSPNGACFVYTQYYTRCRSLKYRSKGAINWWRFYFHGKRNKRLQPIYPIDGWLSKLMCPLGWLFMKYDIHKLSANNIIT